MLDIRTVAVTIPTYERGGDDPTPSLTFGGARKGRARPFPYAMQDDIDIATMRFDASRQYRAVVLGNGLVEATVLPEMNGRLYSLRDLRTGRELFYRNRVVKPALVALRGAWISGGVEFNFPTLGHTVSTVSPVAYGIERSPDEVAVWVGDLDRATRQRWRVRLSLREGRAALDMRVELSNPNLWRERLYYWENAAVPVGDDLRFVCRCDWTVGAESRPFPWRDGVDVSLHTNNPNPCDHFGYRSHADFFGAHYSSRRQGTYHVAPRMEAPGQKYFTWGTREDNKIWEGYLTDADGQYVEIQSGILESQWFTGWLDPLQTVRTEGTWFGVADCGELTWANRRLGVAAQATPAGLAWDVHSVDVADTVAVIFRQGNETRELAVPLQPGRAVSLPGTTAAPCRVEIRDGRGRLLLAEDWSGAESRGLPGDRPAAPPVQWGMRGRSEPAVRVAEAEVKYHRWTLARQALANDVPAEAADRVRAEIALKTADWQTAWTLARGLAERDPQDHASHLLAMVAALGRLRDGEGGAYYEVYDHALVIRHDGRYAAAASLALGEACLLTQRPLAALAALAPVSGSREAEALRLAARRACGEPVAVEPLVQAALAGCGHDPVLADEAFLELVFVWWRAGCRECLDEALRLAPVPEQPMVRLLLGKCFPADRLSWEGVVVSRWEEARLLQGVADTAAGSYLLALWEAENDRAEAAMGRLTEVATGGLSAVRWLARAICADQAAQVAGNTAEAVGHLFAALAERPGDHRLLGRLDDLLRELHDVSRRRELWALAGAALRRRGDVVFRLARLALDEGRGAEAAAMLLAQRFSVYEGGTSIRRLYVDARLVAALDAMQAGERPAAAEHCRAVLDYPENLGAASYLGEHGRLARFLLGLLADTPATAEACWREVLARSGGTTAYTVGGEDTASKLREDERLAVWLSAERLGQAIPPAAEVEQPDSEAAYRTALLGSIRQGVRREDWERGALAQYPCSSLLRILVGLARVLHAG